MNPPRVFISYSHDSAPHKEWVLNLATTLRERGVDAVIDQWDLKPGDDLPHFMETELSRSDFAIMVCTERYVEKANAGEGGVGYEKMIMTSSFLKQIDGNKIIPILRQTTSSNLPTFLGSKLYINFSKDEDIEYNLDELLRVILDAPLYQKPELGKNPFKPMESSKPDRTSDGLKAIMETMAEAFATESAQEIPLYTILKHTTMHRLTLEKYLTLAVKNELLDNSNYYYSVSEKGIEYLISHKIIQA